MPEQNLSTKIFSDIIHFMKYARYLPIKERRETYEETVTRNMDMHIRKYPELEDEIRDVYKLVYDKKVLPSMRSMQFSGKPIEINNTRLYNCAYTPINNIDAFSEVMFLLLSGTGVGISVQKHHVKSLPILKGIMDITDRRHRPKRYLVSDDIAGWADAIKILMKSYFEGTKPIEFDYRDIRSKGERLITSGGKAPGPQPLKDCIHNINKVLNTAIEERGRDIKLKTIEAHDILCYIADAVLAGGIRRSAMISGFSIDDEEMLSCKSGTWWEENPQRGRANNSVVLLRHKIKKEDFERVWEILKNSGSGEPGFYFTNDKDEFSNPCGEISLKPNQLCNLTEVNVSNIESQEDLNERVKCASFIGTLQAGYTDFYYLRDVWRDTIEKDALLGVSMTGIGSGEILKYDLKESSKIAVKENERVSKIIKIKKASRVTTIKPSGTSSSILGCSSGIHAWHNNYYIRRVRIGKNESLYQYLNIFHPELLEDEFYKPNDQSVISIPIKAPEKAIFRSEASLELLDRVKRFFTEWIKPGYRKGNNNHNVSVTVSVKDSEWDEIYEWMWNNRDNYNGISILPYSDHTYVQAPFEDCTEEKYNELYKHLTAIDLTKVIEVQDNTDLQGEVACGGGGCIVK